MANALNKTALQVGTIRDLLVEAMMNRIIPQKDRVYLGLLEVEEFTPKVPIMQINIKSLH